MSGMQPGQPHRGWRGNVGAGGPSARRWRPEVAADAARGPVKRSRTVWLALVSGAFVLVAGVMIAWIQWLRPPGPVYLVLVGADYRDNLVVPHNAFGQRALQMLREWGNAQRHVAVAPSVELTADTDAWKKVLAEYRSPSYSFWFSTPPKVVLYIAAHGGADAEGAYLLPQDVGLTGAKRVRVKTVLEELAQLSGGLHKFLILDATQVPGNWPLGLVHNDFARALKKDVDEAPDVPNLVVLSASDEDQRSWVSEEWGTSIFAHFVLEGLNGAADRNGDGRVTAAELGSHVHDKVEHWTATNRNALQTPVLLDGEDRAGQIEVVATRFGPASQAAPAGELPRFEPPPALAEVWREREVLAQDEPASFAPELWARYLTTFLRYEQIARAELAWPEGPDRQSPRLRERLVSLKGEIEEAWNLPVSAGGTLPLPAALGHRPLSPAQEAQIARAMESLWEQEAPPEKYKEKLQELSKEFLTHQPAAGTLLRLRLCAWLMEQAAKSSRDLEKVTRRLMELDPPNPPRPAEVHYLATLFGDLAKDPPADLVARAVRVRLAAEEAAVGLGGEATGEPVPPACSERVWPWIRSKVDAGDGARRRGEDLLLAADRSDWDRARTHLEEAAQLYREAQTVALAVRRAHLQRDRTFAELPFYGSWIALRPEFDEKLTRDVEALWADLHSLDRLLQKPNETAVREVTAAADKVRREFAALQSAYWEEVRPLMADPNTPVGVTPYLKIEAALAVPFLTAGDRGALVRRSRVSTYQLNLDADQSAPATGLTADQAQERARAAAACRGRLALAQLGEEWFDGDGRTGGAHFADVDKQVRSQARDWWEDVRRRAGPEIALRWRQLPEYCDDQAGQARNGDDLVKAATPRDSAARRARLLDGAAAECLTTAPTREARRLRWHDLLCQLARRAFDDYRGEEDLAKPYYRLAGAAFLADARLLAGATGTQISPRQRESRFNQIHRLEELLDAPDEFKVLIRDGDAYRVESGPLHLSADDQVRRSYRLESPKDAPAGAAVTWAEKGPFLHVAGEAAERRVSVPVGPGAATDLPPFELSLKPAGAGPSTRRTSEDLRIRFRGRRLDRSTPTVFHAEPDLIVYEPEEPRLARLTVQADQKTYNQFALANSAIAIVLDCSGSMGAPFTGGNPNKPTNDRFKKAIGALETALRGLPDNVMVSVRIFRASRIERLWAPKPWRQADLEALLKEVRALKPNGMTPLVDAMVAAKRDDFPSTVRGFKTLVAITDGADDSFQLIIRKKMTSNEVARARAEFPAKKAAATARLAREFKEGDIRLNVIGFDVEPREREAATEFRRVVENEIGGLYDDVKAADKLAERLRQAIRPKLLYGLEHSNGKKPESVPVEGMDVRPAGDTPSWIRKLTPGRFRAEVRVNVPIYQNVELEPGDSLVLSFMAEGRSLLFQRDIFASSFAYKLHPGAQPVSVGDWQLSVLQHQRQVDGLQEMFMLENTKDRTAKDGTLKQIRPGWAWFEIHGAGPGGVLPTQRCYALPGYPAPAWGVDVPRWPPNAGATVETWWLEEQPTATGALRRGTHYSDTLDKLQTAVKVPPGEVVLGDVRAVPNRTVTARATSVQLVTRSAPCLVVQLRYPPGQRIFVKKPKVAMAAEHHFYTEANKYVGIFWDVTADQARSLEKLELMSVDTLKRQATEKGYHAAPHALGEPTERGRPHSDWPDSEWER
jgi:hypothetical protein